MVADVASMVERCEFLTRNRLQLRKITKRMQLLPTRAPPVSVGVYILGSLPKCKSGWRFLVVITDHFTKRTPAVSLGKIDAFSAARAFAEELILKYGAPEMLLSEK